MRPSEHARDVYRASERSPGLPSEPSATDAVEHLLEAGQRLLIERVELAKLDIEDAVSEKVSRGVMVVLPGMFAFGGWWILMAAVVAFLDNYLVLPASLAIVGGAHVLLWGGIAMAAVRQGRTSNHTPRNGGTTDDGGAHTTSGGRS